MINAGNDYVITVKANQKRLYQQIQHNTQYSQPSSLEISTERTRSRCTQRTVSVFDDLKGIDSHWLGLKRLIKVERNGTRAGKPYHQVSYYISSLSLSAAEFAQGIRGHWGIENRLHWVKDVVFHEDHSRMRQANAAANFSIIQSWVLTLLRHHGYSSMTSALRLMAHNLEQIFLLLQ